MRPRSCSSCSARLWRPDELPLLAAAPDQRGDKQEGGGGQRAELGDRFLKSRANGLLLLRGEIGEALLEGLQAGRETLKRGARGPCLQSARFRDLPVQNQRDHPFPQLHVRFPVVAQRRDFPAVGGGRVKVHQLLGVFGKPDVLAAGLLDGGAPASRVFRGQDLQRGSPPLLSLVLDAAQRRGPDGPYRNQDPGGGQGPVKA